MYASKRTYEYNTTNGMINSDSEHLWFVWFIIAIAFRRKKKTKTKQVGKGRKQQSSVKGAKLLQLQTIVGEIKS